MQTKVCARCKKELPATTEYFPPRNRPGRRDSFGVDCYCRACTNQRANERYARNRERVRARAKELRAANADHIREQKKEYRKRCRAYHVAYMQQYNERTAEAKREYMKQYAAANAERIAEYKRQYRVEHGEELRQNNRDWCAANPEKVRANVARRKARVRNAPGHFAPEDLKRQHKAQAGLCFYCYDELVGLGTVDHVIPLARGGTNYPENIVLACWKCNKAKGTMLPQEFMERRPLLAHPT